MDNALLAMLQEIGITLPANASAQLEESGTVLPVPVDAHPTLQLPGMVNAMHVLLQEHGMV